MIRTPTIKGILLLGLIALLVPVTCLAQFSPPFGGGGSGSSAIIASTYEDLFGASGKATLGQMTAGERYSFEFHSKFAPPGGGAVITGSPETLIVTAISASEISKAAESVTYPDDLIRYTPSNSAFSGGNGDRGHILWREYVPRKVAGDFDWRALRVTVSEEVEGSGLFNVLNDSGFNTKQVPVFYATPGVGEEAYFDPPSNTDPMEWGEIVMLTHAGGSDGVRDWPHVSFDRSAYKVYLGDGNNLWRACGSVVEVFQGTCYQTVLEQGAEKFYTVPGAGIHVAKGYLYGVSAFGAVGTVTGDLTSVQIMASWPFEGVINGTHSNTTFSGAGADGPGALSQNLVDDPGFNTAASWSGVTVSGGVCPLNNSSEVVTETAPLTAIAGRQYVVGAQVDAWTSGSFELSVGGAAITVGAGGLFQGTVTATTTAGITITNTDMIGDVGTVWIKLIEN